MSSISIKFEVLPPGPGDDPAEPSAEDVCQALQHQLSDPSSRLRLGEFGRYAQNASLSGPGLPERTPTPHAHQDRSFGMNDHLPSPLSPPTASDAMPGCGAAAATGDSGRRFDGSHGINGGSASGGIYGGGANGGTDAGAGGMAVDDLQHMSTHTLFERLMRAERDRAQLEQKAGGAYAPASMGLGGAGQGDHADRNAPYGVIALEEKCAHLERRLEALERERNEALETARSQKARAEQLERKLQDREQLLVHAKEMWMKENVRASKLADTLTQTEDRLANQERHLGELIERHNEAKQEVRQLQHLLGSNGGACAGPPGSGPFPAGMAASNGSLATAPGLMGRPPVSAGGFSDGYGMELGGAPDIALGSARDLRPSDRRMHPMENGHALEAQLPPHFEPDTNAARFRRLCLLNDAVLYEDDLLQVGIKMEFSGRDGQAAVYLGNKGSAALQAFTVQYYVKEDRALRLSASPMSQQLGADEQVVQRVGIALLEPFVEPPQLRVQFLLPDASPRRIHMQFPVVLTKFMVGRELSPTDFFRFWRQQHFVLNEVTGIVHLAARFQGVLAHIARCLIFGGALRFHHGIDNNPDNFVLVGQLPEPGAGAHHAGMGAGAAGALDPDRGRGGNYAGYPDSELHHRPDAVGADRDYALALVRVEVGSGRYSGKARVVVRSSVHAVARSICDGVIAQLGEANAPHTDGAADAR